MSLLELKDVRKTFGSIEALRGVTFPVEAGSAVALVGDNGAGKSTLMKTITGVHRPDAGEIRFDGVSIVGKDPGRIREAGIEMIYQDLALARMRDVASNIFLGRELTRSVLGVRLVDTNRMRNEAEAMIARLGARIPSVSQMTGQLSGGQQQSVAIARALTFNPKLVIMDEPTAALAVREVEHVLDLIRALKKDGISVILISHRLTDVFSVSDRIVVLRQGQVIADDATRDTSMNASSPISSARNRNPHRKASGDSALPSGTETQLKFGIYYSYWEQEWSADCLKYVEKVAKLGFDVIEIAAHHLNSYSPAHIAEVGRSARDNGITITAGLGPSQQRNLSSADPAVRKAGRAFFEETLTNLAKLDIRHHRRRPPLLLADRLFEARRQAGGQGARPGRHLEPRRFCSQSRH